MLFHEPQVVYALDPEIAPVEATVPSLSHCHAPLVIGGYTAEENGAAKPAQTSFIPSFRFRDQPTKQPAFRQHFGESLH